MKIGQGCTPLNTTIMLVHWDHLSDGCVSQFYHLASVVCKVLMFNLLLLNHLTK